MSETDKPKRRPKIIVTTVRALVVAYATLAAMGFFFSESLIFQPPPAGRAAAAGTFFVQSSDGTDIATLLIRRPGATRVVLHSHGNAEDLGHVRAELEVLAAELGVDVVGYDYPGYGASGGTVSEAGAYRSIEAVYDHLTGELGYDPGQVVLYGRSVGGGPTCHLAKIKPVAALVLESGFVSAFRVVTRIPILPFDRFPNLRHVRTITCPSLFIAGDRDEIIPLWHGQQLFDESPADEKRFEVFKGAGHNDLTLAAGRAYYELLREFLHLDG